MCAGFQFATNNIEEGIGAAKLAQEAGVLPALVLRHAIAPERGAVTNFRGFWPLIVLSIAALLAMPESPQCGLCLPQRAPAEEQSYHVIGCLRLGEQHMSSLACAGTTCDQHTGVLIMSAMRPRDCSLNVTSHSALCQMLSPQHS